MANKSTELTIEARGDLLANVSHELRTPVYGIVGMTELALEEELSPLVRDYLTTARGSAEALLHLVNQILDFSTLRSGKLELEPAPLLLRPLIDETMHNFCAAAAAKSVELVCDVDADVPNRVIGDAGRLRQILTDLLSNAVKFTTVGEVILRVAVDDPQTNQPTFSFQVTDSGQGIASADQKRIFEPFMQVDASSTRRNGGIGLGLPIAIELARLMGGSITAKSSPGKGSTFTFAVSLPRDEQMEPELDSDAAVAPLKGLRVLAVDDNPTQQEVIGKILTELGAEGTVVADGTAALDEIESAIAEQRPYRVVIADARMPGMDGVSVLQQIPNRAMQEVATVLMLSVADEESRSRCSSIGVGTCLEKPVSAASLRAAVSHAKHAALRPDSQRSEAAEDDLAPIPLRVLLAEDTVANQKIVKYVLNRRGHDVEIARNGREVVELIRTQPFDLVLMDVQMPTMDGLQATSAIRALETKLDRRMPIVAMTAHAMPGDRQRCLAAGMDGYLSKPVSAADLIALVESIAAPAPATEPALAPPAVDLHVFNVELAVARLGNDRKLFADLIEFFMEDSPELLRRIHVCLEGQDTAGMTRAAHSLKGLVSSFDAHDATQVAARMEKCGQRGDVDAFRSTLPVLQQEVDRLRTALLRYRARK